MNNWNCTWKRCNCQPYKLSTIIVEMLKAVKILVRQSIWEKTKGKIGISNHEKWFPAGECICERSQTKKKPNRIINMEGINGSARKIWIFRGDNESRGKRMTHFAKRKKRPPTTSLSRGALVLTDNKVNKACQTRATRKLSRRKERG